MRIEYLEAPMNEPRAYSDETRAAVLEQEEARERDWHDFESAVRDFAKAYGVSAMLRAAGRAIAGQQELPL